LTRGPDDAIIPIVLVDILQEYDMQVSLKCQYALRAIFELARRNDSRPAKIAEIAEAQAIPPRFLEVILSQLKQGGFVESRRGSEGGYLLARSPARLTVGEVIRFMQGPVGPVECVVGKSRERCPLYADCAFLPMWEKVRDAISEIYDSTTFENLVEEARLKESKYVPSYAI
jgi:Rrf2 family protein